jgi:hypothetical protein
MNESQQQSVSQGGRDDERPPSNDSSQNVTWWELGAGHLAMPPSAKAQARRAAFAPVRQQ